MTQASYYIFNKPYHAIIKANNWTEAIKTYERDIADIDISKDSTDNHVVEALKIKNSKARVVSENYVVSISDRYNDQSFQVTEKKIKEADPGTVIFYELYLV
ncbi:hypothetical protein [Amphibacillus xylanus]|uniref:Uncharacterized protein n=1 Tax=Amphibacillus xylanus (strain ATCC 51415 / DSM 6626 / JCM 7361 / LMG 17667 / NBRC 15112 / Ep01) TaxID=698758 RepID=K0J5T7_AMPXN|nr:hypothetical protein [Amphibacillus xylanus]BAM46328.1 hypothetical protein AXY_01960 [Amphibacillus xylanus NBRC 15112]